MPQTDTKRDRFADFLTVQSLWDTQMAQRALYARAGFSEAGRRRGYYARTDGSREDALVLALNFSR